MLARSSLRLGALRAHLAGHHHHRCLARPSSSSSSSNTAEDLVLTSSSDAHLSTLTLNRPRSLHALNLDMIRSITHHLRNWENSDHVRAIILRANGRAFCAGGDVVSVISAANSDVPSKRKQAVEFFKLEYELDSFIAKMSTPIISILDGITMGGGLGLTMHTPFRIATENTRLAMPETSIGLFPDVGATFFLPRLDGQIGTYLGLTGTNLLGWAAYQSGFASHFVPSSSLPALEERLVALSPDLTPDRINSTINEFSVDLHEAQHPPNSSKAAAYELVGSKREAIDVCFGEDTVEKILGQLKLMESGQLSFKRFRTLKKDHEEDELKVWAKEVGDILLNRSPTSLELTLMALRQGLKMDIDECFSMEMRLASLCCHVDVHPDFATGVKHLLIDKQKSRPNWIPNTLDQVNRQQIQAKYFSLPSATSRGPNTAQERLTQLEFIPTRRKSFRDYPDQFKLFELPREVDIKDIVLGRSHLIQIGDFAIRDSKELIDIITDHSHQLHQGGRRTYCIDGWSTKVGFKEKVFEILNRKTVVENGGLKWID